MGKRIVHPCQSVAGAINHWSPKMWHFHGKDAGVTGEQLKRHFKFLLFKGIKYIPSGERCEGFSDRRGCPGHYLDGDEETTVIEMAGDASSTPTDTPETDAE